MEAAADDKKISKDVKDTPSTPPKKELVPLLWPYFKPDAGLIGVGAVALLVSSFSNAAAPTLLRAIIDNSTRAFVGREGSTMAKSERQMLMKALAVFAVGAIGSWLRTRCFGIVSARVGNRIRRRLFQVILEQDTSFFDFGAEKGGMGVAEMEGRLGKDVDECTHAVTTNFGNILRFSSSAICGSIMVIRVGATSSTLRLAFLGVSVLAAAVPASLMKKKNLDRSKAELKFNSTASSERVLEKVRGIRTVVAFGRGKFESEAYGELAATTARAEESVAKSEAAYMGTLDLCFKAGTVCVAAYGSSLVRRGHLTAGQLSAFLLYSGMAGMGLAGLLRSARSDWASASWRLLQLLGRSKDPSVASKGPLPPASSAFKGHVKFEDVSFAYATSTEGSCPTGPLVLSKVNLEVKPGEAVVLMGPSGCGKSTTGRLLLGLYEPISGRITIDGIPLTPYNASLFREYMGVVEQDAPLWSCSIRENIRYGNLGASDSDVEEAAKTANAHEFIMALPRGYKTVLDKGGVALSGGQRQRLAIARAIIKRPPILLLDEATASLDADCESSVLEALRQAMAGRTVLAIAHNDATISQLGHNIATMELDPETSGYRISMLAK